MAHPAATARHHATQRTQSTGPHITTTNFAPTSASNHGQNSHRPSPESPPENTGDQISSHSPAKKYFITTFSSSTATAPPNDTAEPPRLHPRHRVTRKTGSTRGGTNYANNTPRHDDDDNNAAAAVFSSASRRKADENAHFFHSSSPAATVAQTRLHNNMPQGSQNASGGGYSPSAPSAAMNFTNNLATLPSSSNSPSYPNNHFFSSPQNGAPLQQPPTVQHAGGGGLSMRLSMPFRTAFTQHGGLGGGQGEDLFREDFMDNVFQRFQEPFGFTTHHPLRNGRSPFDQELGNDLLAGLTDHGECLGPFGWLQTSKFPCQGVMPMKCSFFGSISPDLLCLTFTWVNIGTMNGGKKHFFEATFQATWEGFREKVFSWEGFSWEGFSWEGFSWEGFFVKKTQKFEDVFLLENKKSSSDPKKRHESEFHPCWSAASNFKTFTLLRGLIGVFFDVFLFLS